MTNKVRQPRECACPGYVARCSHWDDISTLIVTDYWPDTYTVVGPARLTILPSGWGGFDPQPTMFPSGDLERAISHFNLRIEELLAGHYQLYGQPNALAPNSSSAR